MPREQIQRNSKFSLVRDVFGGVVRDVRHE